MGPAFISNAKALPEKKATMNVATAICASFLIFMIFLNNRLGFMQCRSRKEALQIQLSVVLFQKHDSVLQSVR